MGISKSALALDGIDREMLALRFRAKLREEPTGCLVFTGTRTPHGYGVVTIRKPVTCLAHRVAWELAHGAIPNETPLVLHRCDNPPCVRLDHLFLGTPADNMRDMFAKGRRPTVALRGSANPQARLTEADVRDIRAGRGVHPACLLMERYGVGQSTIYRLWDDDDPSWAHVKAEALRDRVLT